MGIGRVLTGPVPLPESHYNMKIERIAFLALTMGDYYSLLVRALEALDSNTMMARRQVYRIARDALVQQACAIEPAIRGTDLTKERLSLERAIRKVEAEELEGDASKKALIKLARHIEDIIRSENSRQGPSVSDRLNAA